MKWYPLPSGGYVTEVLLQDPYRVNNKLWIYRPTLTEKSAPPVPCVVMAAAGSPMFIGSSLGQGSQLEHIGYLSHKIAVVACEVDGAVSEEQLEDANALAAASKQFLAADAGIANLRAGVAVARALPWVDKKRIYVAGHSSAATLALQTAAYEPSVAGVIAHAPEVNVTQRVAAAIDFLEENGAPNAGMKLDALSPHNNLSRISKPAFLFYAEDDTVISTKNLKDFAQTLQKTNPKVTLYTVPSGGHYKPMILFGIPHAAEWINKGP